MAVATTKGRHVSSAHAALARCALPNLIKLYSPQKRLGLRVLSQSKRIKLHVVKMAVNSFGLN